MNKRHVFNSTYIIFFEFANEIEIAYRKKEASVCGLSHSFTTHPLESEVDLSYVQEIIGNDLSKTTKVYSYLSNKASGKIKSSLNSLCLSPRVKYE